MDPLVSCVMPTTGARRTWISRAIRYWQRQSYGQRELIIVSSGEAEVGDLIPRDDRRIRYEHISDTDITLGEKRNYANRLTRGRFIAHWDDDDWYHQDRLAWQVAEMLKRSDPVCGIRDLFWVRLDDRTAWQYRWPSAPDSNPNAGFWNHAVNGNTLFYERAFWEEQELPPMQKASDMHWLLLRDFTSCIVPSHLVVGAIHADNVSSKGELRPPYFHEIEFSKLLEVAGPDDLDEFLCSPA